MRKLRLRQNFQRLSAIRLTCHMEIIHIPAFTSISVTPGWNPASCQDRLMLLRKSRCNDSFSGRESISKPRDNAPPPEQIHKLNTIKFVG